MSELREKTLTEQTLNDLPRPVRDLAFKTLDVFVKSGPPGLAESGLFPIEYVPVAAERAADFGGRFRIPPLGALVYVFKDGDVYDLDFPLWLEGEEDRNDLFIFLEVDTAAGVARVRDIYVP